ncbi:hypothetical protein LP122_09115 [Moraxella bovis]|uniref:hypothetical protein n=1 Tax=Moraxella bovis TaxID=476 RepID=UPI002227167E|nr:hypothetical protein [Moraxella bovis]UYZ67927.1 hypothetical protein LP122_09115 [Moraxella bovis]UZA28044.1 hypothetical protein LP119_03490 [Moraxella bovis]UZA37414.1 hypothetical protein LP101_09560 [Moraxella bovis]WAJ74239.1 hypothetical protein LP095_03495 [Moraxella bovis]
MKNFVGFVIFDDFFTIIQRASDYNNANYQHKRHTMTQKYDMTELWSKWTALVWLNAILGLFLGGFLEVRLWTYNIGIFFGIWVFVPIYVFLDKYALDYQYKRLRKYLWISVVIRAFMQLIMVVDLFAGAIAYELVGGVMGFSVSSPEQNIGFFGAFFLTVVTGGILSFVGAILTAVIMAIMIFGDYLKNNGDKR